MKSFILIALLIALSLSENTNFDYSDHGDNWAPTWDNCDPNNEEMNQQSPIEITEDITHSNQSFLFSNFYSASATLSFLNTTVYLKSGSFGEIYSKTVGGDIIVMKATEMRFRSHSEHKVYGQFYDVEMQIFFMEAISSSRNARLGLSILFEQAEGSSNAVLKAIKNAYPDKTSVKIDLSELLNNDQPFDFWYYEGSATVPPCKNKALEWIVPKKIFKMSQEERDFFWNLFNSDNMDGNYRSIQPLRGNKVDYFHFSSV